VPGSYDAVHHSRLSILVLVLSGFG